MRVVVFFKIVKKLAGSARKTASWCTNVGNEHGQVLMSVLTDTEGDGLDDMAEGLMDRYIASNTPPPKVLYVDRDCCSTRSKQQFHKFPNMVIRLDIWHFMRRLAMACCSESHALYGTFMLRLSGAIFEWDPDDMAKLYEAKEAQLSSSGILAAQHADIAKYISKKESATHCKRRTQGSEECLGLIEQLLETFSSDLGKDTMGIPLLDADRTWQIWDQQKRHLPCIQDPQGINLYTCTGHITKGNVKLPTYRCARGSTSLESFHLHIARFIPGSTANDTTFQAYLLEGMVRWNQDRGAKAVEGQPPAERTYNSALQNEMNRLTTVVYGEALFPNYQAPRAYTGKILVNITPPPPPTPPPPQTPT